MEVRRFLVRSFIALWVRDRAVGRHGIGGVRDKTEICGDVFDLGTVLEFLATRKSVADSFLVQSLFDEIECMTCSNENRYLLARTAGSDIDRKSTRLNSSH